MSTRRSLIVDACLVIAAVFSVGFTGWTAIARRAPAVSFELSTGDKWPTLAVSNQSQSNVDLGSGAGCARLILFFSHTCPYCDQIAPTWASLLQQSKTDQTNCEAVAISASEEPLAQKWLEDYQVGAPLYHLANIQGFIKDTGYRGTPTTVVLRGSTVAFTHSGLLSDAQVAEIEKLLRRPGGSS